MTTKRDYGSASGRHKTGESEDWEHWILCDLSELLEDEVAEQTAPFPFPSIFPLRDGGVGGGAVQKCKGNGAGLLRPR